MVIKYHYTSELFSNSVCTFSTGALEICYPQKEFSIWSETMMLLQFAKNGNFVDSLAHSLYVQ